MGRAAPGPCPLPLRSHVPIPRYRPVPGPPRPTRQSAPPLLCPASRGPISTAFTLLRLSRANQRDPWWCARAGSFRKRLGSARGGAGPSGRGARRSRPQRGRARGRGAGWWRRARGAWPGARPARGRGVVAGGVAARRAEPGVVGGGRRRWRALAMVFLKLREQVGIPELPFPPPPLPVPPGAPSAAARCRACAGDRRRAAGNSMAAAAAGVRAGWEAPCVHSQVPGRTGGRGSPPAPRLASPAGPCRTPAPERRGSPQG